MIAERFQKLAESALFCPAPKMLKAPSDEGAFLVSAAVPSGSLATVVVCLLSHLGSPTWGSRVLLRQHRTQPGTIVQSFRFLRFDWSCPPWIFTPSDSSVAGIAIPMVKFTLHNLRWNALWERIAGQAGRYPSDVPETRYALV